jgi:uncharacterized protein YerC
MKRKPKDLSREETVVTLDTLYTAVSSVRGRDAVKLLLRDLLTPSERIMLGRRLIIARMLIGGESYESISERLRVGYTTIARIHRWLEDQFPGFEEAIKGVEKEFSGRKQRMSANQSTIARLKRKYPLHFLFFPNPKKK